MVKELKNLRGFMTLLDDDPAVRSEFVKSDLNIEITDNRYVHRDKNEKVLGIEWDDRNDQLIFNVCELLKHAGNIQPTKRNILSIISKIYDSVPSQYLNVG